MTLKMPLRLAGALVLTALAAAMAAPQAQAADADPFLEQCFGATATATCTGVTGYDNAIDVVVSPDGKHVYTTSQTAEVRAYSRGARNLLAPLACYNLDGSDGCTNIGAAIKGGNIYDLDISPDGRSLYLGGSNLGVLQRDVDTGGLTATGCWGSSVGCVPIAPVGRPLTVVVSRDGNNVYTRGDNTFGAFERNPATGAISPEDEGEDCFSETPQAGCSDSYGLGGNAFEMDFSPDGRFLYYPIQSPGGIGFFQRAANGTLSQISGPQGGCITVDGSSTAPGECAKLTPEACDGPPDPVDCAMGNSWATTVSPSGNHVFVSGSSGTVAFSRDGDTGKMTRTDCVAPQALTGCKQSRGSAGMGVAVSPDGKRAIVGGEDVRGVGVYDFDAANGTFTQLPGVFGCFSANNPACTQFSGGTSYGKIAWAPDSLNFYFATLGSLVNVVQDYAPRCVNVSANIPHNTAGSVKLECSDVNGDAMTYSKVSGPTKGTTADVDQGAATVFYNPFSGFGGTDSFTYKATARGVDSNAATATLNVAGPVIDNDKDGVSPPADCDDNNAAVRPGAAEVPGNKIDEDCVGGDKALPPGRIASGVDFFFDARNLRFTKVGRLDVTTIPAGATLQVRCIGGKKKGCKFKSKKRTFTKAAAKFNAKRYFNFTKKVKRKGKKALKRKVISKLKKGTKIEIRVTKAGMIGKVVTFTTRRGKTPTFIVTCLPLGSTRPQKAC